MLESIYQTEFLNDDELDLLVKLIHQKKHHVLNVDYQISGELWAKDHIWDYYADNTQEIRDILEPKIEKLFGRKLLVGTSHILESLKPYKLHNDTHHRNNSENPEYVLLIPIDNTDSSTIVFNESYEDSNEFSDYKSTVEHVPSFSLDPAFCNQYLSHINPKDLRYLTLKDAFKWQKGGLIAFDRRYFHCSNNFKRDDVESKQCIIIWTYTE